MSDDRISNLTTAVVGLLVRLLCVFVALRLAGEALEVLTAHWWPLVVTNALGAAYVAVQPRRFAKESR